MNNKYEDKRVHKNKFINLTLHFRQQVINYLYSHGQNIHPCIAYRIFSDWITEIDKIT